MDVDYTEHYNLPKGEGGLRSWGAIANGIADKIDDFLWRANNPICKNGEVLTKNGEVITLSPSMDGY